MYRNPNLKTGMYMAVSGSSFEDGARVIQWRFSEDNPDQIWYTPSL